jgi:hypothetical protein
VCGPRFCLKVLKKRPLTRAVLSVTSAQARHLLNISKALLQNYACLVFSVDSWIKKFPLPHLWCITQVITNFASNIFQEHFKLLGIMYLSTVVFNISQILSNMQLQFFLFNRFFVYSVAEVWDIKILPNQCFLTNCEKHHSETQLVAMKT